VSKKKDAQPLEALERTYAWLMEHGDHNPTCSRRQPLMVPDGAYRSGLTKDCGGRYATDEERAKVPCSCGWDELIALLCTTIEAARRSDPVLIEARRLLSQADGREYITRLRKRGWRQPDAETAAGHYCDGLNAALRILAKLSTPASD